MYYDITIDIDYDHLEIAPELFVPDSWRKPALIRMLGEKIELLTTFAPSTICYRNSNHNDVKVRIFQDSTEQIELTEFYAPLGNWIEYNIKYYLNNLDEVELDTWKKIFRAMEAE